MGCRDCQTCTATGSAKSARAMAAGFMHLCTCGLSWVASRMFARHCPQCSHLMGRHARRADGAFID